MRLIHVSGKPVRYSLYGQVLLHCTLCVDCLLLLLLLLLLLMLRCRFVVQENVFYKTIVLCISQLYDTSNKIFYNSSALFLKK